MGIWLFWACKKCFFAFFSPFYLKQTEKVMFSSNLILKWVARVENLRFEARFALVGAKKSTCDPQMSRSFSFLVEAFSQHQNSLVEVPPQLSPTITFYMSFWKYFHFFSSQTKMNIHGRIWRWIQVFLSFFRKLTSMQD